LQSQSINFYFAPENVQILGTARPLDGQMKTIMWICFAAIAACVLVYLSSATSQGSKIIAQFSEVTDHVGMHYRGMSYGAACGDFDGDGNCDIYVPRHFQHRAAALLRNEHASFIDVSDDVLANPDIDRSGDRHSSVFVDIDDDGDQDLAVATGAKHGTGEVPKKVFVNSGNRLSDVAAAIGLAEPLLRGRGFLFLDVNGDAFLDAVVSARRRMAPRIGHSVYFQHREKGQITYRRAPQAWNFVDDDGEFAQFTWLPGVGPALFVHGWPSHLYAIGKDSLEDITDRVGLYGLGSVSDAAWADFDGDGDLDLYCATGLRLSDATTNNRGQVESELISAGQDCEVRITPRQSNDQMTLRVWGAAPAEIYIGSNGLVARSTTLTLDPTKSIGLPNSTWRSLCVGFEPARRYWRIVSSSQSWSRTAFIASFANGVSRVAPAGFSQSDAFLRDRVFFWEGHRFVEKSRRAGPPRTAAASVAAADFDCDGDVDVYVVCSTYVRNLPNLLLENDGAGHFAVHEDGAGAAGSSDGCGDAVAILDYDNDGGPDLFITNGQGDPPFCDDGPEQLFRNVGDRGHWLEVDLVGKGANRDAIGARVTVIAGGRKFFRLQDGGVHCRAQNHSRLHFGLGAAATVEKIEVVWPDGDIQRISTMKADRLITIKEP
jgi:hypothetical protein